MTTRTLTYLGPPQRARIALPDRTVFVTAGDPVEFSDDEAQTLDPTAWAGEAIGKSLATATIADVLAWVDGDPGRAAQALETETAHRARSTLVATLTELAAATPTNTSAAGADTQEA